MHLVREDGAGTRHASAGASVFMVGKDVEDIDGAGERVMDACAGDKARIFLVAILIW
jgi:hypothetical protein